MRLESGQAYTRGALRSSMVARTGADFARWLQTCHSDALKSEQAVSALGADREASTINFLGVNFKKAKAKAAAQFSGH